MHDSRGAELRVGDRVWIEAEITRLNDGGDENYCCVDVKVVTPDQPVKAAVMEPPSFYGLSTRMLTKIGAVCLLLAFAFPAFAQDTINERLSRLEESSKATDQAIAGIHSMLAAQKSMIENVDQKVDRLTDKVDALAKAMLPKDVKFAASTLDVWGRGTPATFSTTGAAVNVQQARPAIAMQAQPVMLQSQPMFQAAPMMYMGGGMGSSMYGGGMMRSSAPMMMRGGGRGGSCGGRG